MNVIEMRLIEDIETKAQIISVWNCVARGTVT